MRNIVVVTWKDHYSEAGWFEEEIIDVLVHLNLSVGFLLKEEGEYITIAQTAFKEGSTVADVLHILKQDIVSIESMEVTGLYYANTTN